MGGKTGTLIGFQLDNPVFHINTNKIVSYHYPTFYRQ